MVAAGIGAASGFMQAGINSMAQDAQHQLSQQQRDDLLSALAKIENINTPGGNFNLSAPEAYALQHYAMPEDAKYQQVQIDPQDRVNQMQALQKLQGYSNGAADSELNAANYNARNNAAMQRQRSDAATMQSLSNRGVAGSGLELAMKQQASQNAANSALSGGLDAAKNNALAKLQGNNAYLQGLGSMRGQDTDLATSNANIINQFNMANSNMRNRVNMANTDMANKQSMMNVGQNNDYAKYMAEQKQKSAQQEFDNKLTQARAAAGQQTSNASTNYGNGMTGAALGANTAGALAGAAGNAAQGIYQSVSSGNNDKPAEKTPQTLNVEHGSTFTGAPQDDEEGYEI